MVVFIHGLADCKEAFEPVCQDICKAFPCCGVDLPGKIFGSGKSRLSKVEQIAKLLLEFLAGITDKPTVLFGSSFGSTVAIQMALQAPGKVAGLVLQGGFVFRPLGKLERLAARLASLLPMRADRIPFLEAGIKHQHFGGFKHGSQSQWERFIENISPARCDLAGRHAFAIHEVDHRDKASSLDFPVLLLDGEEDPLVGPDARKLLYDSFPNAQKEVVPGGAHLLPYSHPEEITRHLHQFLAKVFGR